MFTSIFNNYISPLTLMICSPLTILYMYDNNYMFGYMPGNYYSWSMTLCFMLFQYILLMLSSEEIRGPLTTKNDMGYYKGNSIDSYMFTIYTYMMLIKFDVIDPVEVFDNLGYFFSTFIIIGFVFSTMLYVKGLVCPNSVDNSNDTKNVIFDYYWGLELHPRCLGVDIKQFTNCRFGMMLWPLLLITYMWYQYRTIGYITNSLLCNCLLQLCYITKFFYWEDGYFSTIDVMIDKAGFYICWGCIAFLPLFYTSHSLYLAYHPIDLSIEYVTSLYILGLSSIFLNYYVDYERKVFREKDGNITTFGNQAQYIRVMYADDKGGVKKSILLKSGFWGIARHINYLFELLATLSWSLPCLFDSIYPYCYLFFLTVLLIHRERRDDERCSEKYKKYWDMYKEAVPYRIIKYIY